MRSTELRTGTRVLARGEPGGVAYVRTAPPNHEEVEAISVVLDSERGRPGYQGTVFPVAEVELAGAGR